MELRTGWNACATTIEGVEGHSSRCTWRPEPTAGAAVSLLVSAWTTFVLPLAEAGPTATAFALPPGLVASLSAVPAVLAVVATFCLLVAFSLLEPALRLPPASFLVWPLLPVAER